MKKVMSTFLSFIIYTGFAASSCFGSYTNKPVCMSKLHCVETYNSESSGAEVDYKLTSDRIIEVYNQKDLEFIREKVNKGVDSYKGKVIVLKSCIYLKNWKEPIGNDKHNFEGTFEGEKRTLCGFTGEPLFGCINKSIIADLNVKGIIFNREPKVNRYLSFNERLKLTALGGIAKVAANSSFEFCENECKVEGKNCIGGICGFAYNNVSFFSCINGGTLIGKGAVGGILGAMHQECGGVNCNKINLSYCKNSAEIMGKGACGGLIGYIQGLHGHKNFLTLESCANDGNIETSEDNVGGFIGEAVAQIRVCGCINNGKVQGSCNIGGFCGSLGSDEDLVSSLTVEGSTNLGSISGDEFIGGFLGYGHNMKADYSKNDGNIAGREKVGGLSGKVDVLLLKGALNEGNIKGSFLVGGLCGYCSKRFNLDKCINKGQLFGIKNVGNLIGGSSKDFLPI